MQLTILKQSFFFFPSYKYVHLKCNFFSETNVEEDVEDVAFPVFGFAKTTAVVVWHTLFDPTIPGDYLRRQLRLNRNTLSVPMNILRPCLTSQNVERKKKISFTELTGRFITRKTIFVCCSQKVMLRGRTTAPLKICLRGQVFVRVETSR